MCIRDRRDSEWMGKVYRFLGLTVGLVIHGVDKDGKKAAYAADITYGTNNEFGFDYLRDNMAIYASELVQRGHSFAIVDEVDSCLLYTSVQLHFIVLHQLPHFPDVKRR